MAAIWVPARMFRDWWPKAAALPKRWKSLKASPEESWNPAGNTAIRSPLCSGARFGRSANTAFLFLSLKWDASQDFPTGKLRAVSERPNRVCRNNNKKHIRRLECQTKHLHPRRLLSSRFMRMKKVNTECFPLKELA